MKKIYICSPLRGDIDRNIERALDHCREVAELGCLPIAPHVYFTRFLDDTNPEERALGLRLGLELLKICDELWVYSQIPSEGMRGEMEMATALGIPVRDAIFAYALAQRAAETGQIEPDPAPGPRAKANPTPQEALAMLRNTLGPDATAAILAGALGNALKGRQRGGSPFPPNGWRR